MHQRPLHLRPRNLPNRAVQLLRIGKVDRLDRRDTLRRHRIRIELRMQRNPRQDAKLRPRINPSTSAEGFASA